jgi:3-hydroxybutyryl-CoA dehydrogenase
VTARGEEIRRVLVVGAGTMGRGIAQVAASAGLEAALYDVDEVALERAVEKVRASILEAIEKGKLPPEAAKALSTLGRVSDLAKAARWCDLAIEAAPESLDLKRRIFADLDAAAREDAILASNTSSLSITAIAEAVRDPARVLGMHFFNPPPLMKLLEIVRGARTSEQAVEAARAVAARMGKEPIVVQDSPGFASSRLGIALGLEAIRMLEAGVASAEDIDKAMELGYRHPMGPLKLTDLVGLDVRLAIADHLARELGPRFEAPRLLREMVAAGKLGKKAGEGFYKYS